MAEPPPRDPREPVDPLEDETVVVPPAEQTVVDDTWEPESEVFVEQTEIVPPRRRPPLLWPGLLALLVLVLGGLAAGYFLTRDDDEPAATTTAPPATSVESLRVPDVVGTTSSEATQTLRDAGFEANVVAVPSDRPSGQVVAQNPAAGDDAPEGSTVRLNVAQEAAETTPATTGATTTAPTTTAATTTTPAATTAPPAAPTVPDAVGQELADAARAFADEWLNVAVQYVPSNEAAGRVVAQAQPAGTVLKRGDSVQLNISTGAEPAAEATVPDVVGQRLDRGRSALEQAGFEVLALRRGTGEVRRENEVASQTPAARASIPRGSLVLLYVSA
jgi:beta-lactam-binding protein with PASTA domain